jgi:hypothetical protein
MSKRQMFMTLVLVVVVGIAITGFNAWSAHAQGPTGNYPSCGQGYGSGMMGGHMHGGHHGMGMMMGGGMMEDCPFADDAQHASGMMGRGMMGHMMSGARWMGQMMESWTPSQDLAPAGDVLTQDEATKVAEAYLATLGDDTLSLGDVAEFNGYFHVTVVQKDSGNFAFGFMIDAATGQVWAHHWDSTLTQ